MTFRELCNFAHITCDKYLKENEYMQETQLIGTLIKDEKRNLEMRGMIVEDTNIYDQYVIRINASLFSIATAIDNSPLSYFFPNATNYPKSDEQRKSLYGE
jgi:hypothetical protein